jgi:hypothetical protein
MISDSNNDGMLLYSEFLMIAWEIELKSDNRSEQPHRTLNTKKMKLMFNELISMCEEKIGDKGKCMEETSGVKVLWVPQSMAGESGSKITTSPLSKKESSFISIVCVNTKRMKSETNRKGRRLSSSSALYNNNNISSRKHEGRGLVHEDYDWDYDYYPPTCSPTLSPSMVPSSAPSEDTPPPPPLYLVGLIFLAINMRVCYACFKRNKEQNRLGYATPILANLLLEPAGKVHEQVGLVVRLRSGAASIFPVTNFMQRSV